jgi:hypothetical protein
VSTPGRRAALLVVAAVLLAAAAAVLVVLGVQVRETTGGLLVTPIRQLHLDGGALLGGTAAGVAAVLVALSAVPAVRRARRDRDTDRDTDRDADRETGPPVTDREQIGDAHDPAGDTPTAAFSPGPDRRT